MGHEHHVPVSGDVTGSSVRGERVWLRVNVQVRELELHLAQRDAQGGESIDTLRAALQALQVQIAEMQSQNNHLTAQCAQMVRPIDSTPGITKLEDSTDSLMCARQSTVLVRTVAMQASVQC